MQALDRGFPETAKQAAPNVVLEARDFVAAEFASSIRAEMPKVLRILESQLQDTHDRDRWRPMLLAAQVIRALGPGFGDKLAECVRERFDARLALGGEESAQATYFTLTSLSLVSDDQMQEEVSIVNVSRGLREASAAQFHVLNKRLAAALGRTDFQEDASPVHPRLFVRALLDALADSGGDLSARLAALPAFEPSVRRALPMAYRAGDNLLAQRGVLVDLRRGYGTPQQLTAQAPAQGATKAPAGFITLQVRPELVEALRELESKLQGELGPETLNDVLAVRKRRMAGRKP